MISKNRAHVVAKIIYSSIFRFVYYKFSTKERDISLDILGVYIYTHAKKHTRQLTELRNAIVKSHVDIAKRENGGNEK